MKSHCFNCGREFEWEQPQEDWQLCNDCGGTGVDGIDDCVFCGGSGVIDLNADEIPICEDCLMKEEEEIYKEADHETPT